MDIDRINQTKKACVALGIIEKNQRRPQAILGSGFFINSDRHILTAKHVLDKCTEWYRTLNQNEIRYEVAAFHVEQTEHKIDLHVIPLSEFLPLALSLTNYPIPYAGPSDLDIGIGIPGGKGPVFSAPYLDFDNGERPSLYSDIHICGYPAGSQSLDPFNRFIGLRFAPVIQFGHISGFMPTDFIINPYAIQTDIVGTGGSSGSPIINTENGKVVGIAQQVLKSDVKLDLIRRTNGKIEKAEASGSSNLGLIYGISTHLIPTLPKDIQHSFDSLDEGRPIRFQFRSCNLRQVGV